MFTVLLLICLCKSKFENDAGYCLVVAYKIHRICTPNVKSSFLQVKKTNWPWCFHHGIWNPSHVILKHYAQEKAGKSPAGFVSLSIKQPKLSPHYGHLLLDDSEVGNKILNFRKTCHFGKIHIIINFKGFIGMI